MKEPCEGEVFGVGTRGERDASIGVDSLESSTRTAEDLAERIACLENDVASKSLEIEQLRDQAMHACDPVLTYFNNVLLVFDSIKANQFILPYFHVKLQIYIIFNGNPPEKKHTEFN